MTDTLTILGLLACVTFTASVLVTRAFKWIEPRAFPLEAPRPINVVECAHARRQADATRTWVKDCPSCAGEHRVDLVLYASSPPGKSTHWYFCEVHLDPVPVEMSLRLGTT